MVKKISKKDISGPSLLPTSYAHDPRYSFDSGIGLRKESLVEHKDKLQQKRKEGLVPFSVGRHDVSVSLVGGPSDPRRYENGEPKRLSIHQYQNLVHSLGAYRRQLQAMSSATEVLVRSLQEFADCVPEGKFQF
jgi:hypothetical protein